MHILFAVSYLYLVMYCFTLSALAPEKAST